MKEVGTHISFGNHFEQPPKSQLFAIPTSIKFIMDSAGRLRSVIQIPVRYA